MPVGVDIQDLHVQLEVKNFEATCMVTTSEAKREFQRHGVAKYFVELPCDHIFSIDGKRFKGLIQWEAKKDDQGNAKADQEALLGVRVFLEPGNGNCFMKLRAVLLNTNPSKHHAKQEPIFIKLEEKADFGWGPALDFNRENIGFVKLGDVLNPAKGWLHDGTLKANLELSIAVNHNATSVARAGPDTLRSLSKDLLNLLSKGTCSDVVIKVNEEEIRAHSIILMARSDVLASMLTLPMREATEKIVTINDLSMTAVRAMVTFMYSDRVDEDLLKSDTHVMRILEAAHRYNVPDLVDLCVNKLSTCLAVESVSELLRVADLIGQADLKMKCLQFMCVNIAEVQTTDSYEKVVTAHPTLLKDIMSFMFPPAKRRKTKVRKT